MSIEYNIDQCWHKFYGVEEIVRFQNGDVVTYGYDMKFYSKFIIRFKQHILNYNYSQCFIYKLYKIKYYFTYYDELY